MEEKRIEESTQIISLQKKKNRILLGILIVLILLFVFCASFMGWYFIFGKDNTKEDTSEQVNIVEKEEPSESVNEQIIESPKKESATKINNLEDAEKFMERYQHVPVGDDGCINGLHYLLYKNVVAKDIKIETINEIIAMYFYENNKEKITNAINNARSYRLEDIKFSVEEFKKIGKILFGEDYDVTITNTVNLLSGCNYFILDEDGKNYTLELNDVCGGICTPMSVVTKIDKYEIKDDTLTIDYKLLFACQYLGSEDMGSLCSDQDKKIVVGKHNGSGEGLFDKATTTLRLTFKVGKEDYYFVNSKMIE